MTLITLQRYLSIARFDLNSSQRDFFQNLLLCLNSLSCQFAWLAPSISPDELAALREGPLLGASLCWHSLRPSAGPMGQVRFKINQWSFFRCGLSWWSLLCLQEPTTPVGCREKWTLVHGHQIDLDPRILWRRNYRTFKLHCMMTTAVTNVLGH